MKELDLNNLTPIQAERLLERGERIRSGRPVVDVSAILEAL